MGVKILFLLLAVVFFCACVIEPSIEARLLCIDLTSYSMAEIPKCNSQEKCFFEVEDAFVKSNKVFPPLIENNLTELKNHIALSWLYFNRSIESLHSIHESCLSSRDLFSLDTAVNELNFSLVRAFEESDKAHSLAFAILLLEKSHLENEEVELVKEEKIFDDFIALNNNLNELGEGRAFGENSFASNYFLNVKRFEELSKKFSFEKVVIGQVMAIDIISGFDEKILSHLPKKPFYIPLIADSFSSLINYVAANFTLHRAVDVMKTFPSFEILEVFNRFVGEKNSSLKEFFELNESIKENISKINIENEERKEKIVQEFELIQNQISQIDDSTYSNFDKNFLSELAVVLSEGTSIESGFFEISEFNKLKSDSSLQLFELKKEFNKIGSEEFLFEISLGEKTFKLKELKAKAVLLSENIDFLTKDAITGLTETCNQRVAIIGKKISKTDYFSFGEEFSVIAQKIKNKIQEFDSTQELTQKLLLCKPIVTEYNSLNFAIENFDEFELAKKNEFENCFLEMETIFKTGSNYFLDLSPLFAKLASLREEGKENNLLATCENLKEKVNYSFNEIKEVQEITSNHYSAKKIFEQIQILKTSFSELVPANKFRALKKKLEDQEKFFNSKGLDPAIAIFNLPELKANSFNLLEEAKEFFSKYFVEYLLNQVEISTTSEEIVKANTYLKNTIKILIKNELENFDEKLSLKVELSGFEEVELVSASSNVKEVKKTNDTVKVELSSVPLGETEIVLSSHTVIAKTNETLKNHFLTETYALMEHVLVVKAKTKIALLEVSTTIAEFEKIDPASVNVLFGQLSLPFSFEGKKIVFKANNVLNKDKISIFYEIINPLEIDVELKENIELDANKFEYLFEVKIFNSTNLEFKNAKVSIPLPITETNFSKIKVFDERGKKISFEKTISNNISIKIPEMFPKQTKNFSVKIEVENYSEYWQNFINDLEQKIGELVISEIIEINEKASWFEKELEEIENEGGFENSKKIEELLNLSKKITQTTNESGLFESEKAKFFELKNQLEEEIENLKEKLTELVTLGFQKEAVEIEKNIEKTELLKNQANQKLAKDPVEAFFLLLNAKNALTQIMPKGFLQELQKQKNQLMEKIGELLELKIDKALGKEINDLKKEIEKLLGENSLIVAAEKISILSEKIFELESVLQEKITELFFGKKEKIGLFNEITQSTPEKIDLLKTLFDSKKNYSDLEYNFPTTPSRLNKLLLKFNSLLDPSLIEKINSINFSGQDPIAQFSLLTELGKGFDKIVEDLKKIDEEVSSDLKKIGLDAKTVFEFALTKSKNYKINENAKDALFLAEQKMNQKEFIESMELSKKAIGLMTLSRGFNFQIPIAIYPLILIIVTALFFRYKKNTTPLPKKTKIKRAKKET